MKFFKNIFTGITVEAVQIMWKTWNEVCALDVVSHTNPGRSVQTFSDTCGEIGPPWIELTVATWMGPWKAQHGDWIVKYSSGASMVIGSKVFGCAFTEVDRPKLFDSPVRKMMSMGREFV